MRPTILISIITLIVTPLALARSSSIYGDMYRRALIDEVPVNRRDSAIPLLEILERRALSQIMKKEQQMVRLFIIRR